MLVARPETHLELIDHLNQHYLGLEESEVLAKAAARTHTEGCKDKGEVFLIRGRVQPSIRVEVVRIGEVLLVVHVLCPSRHDQVAK